MPMNLGFVVTCYAVWLLAFVIYIPMLRSKLKQHTQALEAFQQKK
ncbi:hypothetical protein WDW89_14440 [Deltaproteobacteria bacterium TL4]